MVAPDLHTAILDQHLDYAERIDRRWTTRQAPIDTEGRPLIDGHDYVKVDDGEVVYIPTTIKAIRDYLAGFCGRDRNELSDDKVDLLDDVQEIDPYAEMIPWMQ